jgi:hypothetical protein
MAWAPKEFDASQAGKGAMSDWLHNLPIVGMALVVFGAAYLLAAIVHIVVTALAIGERARSFKAFSPGMLSPLGVLVGLLLAFTAAQVWSDNDRAAAAVNREASALKSVLVFAAAFPGEPEARLRTLVRQYIEETATQEWPMMAHRSATLSISPRPLADSLMLAIGLPSGAAGQQTAQREIIASLESALDARRQRILVSRSEVNPVKWIGLIAQIACTLVAIAVVHSDNRLASTIAMAAFSTAVGASALLILSHDRPFLGQISVGPEPLLQVMPQEDVNKPG